MPYWWAPTLFLTRAPRGDNPYRTVRTAVSFWGQSTPNLTGLPRKRDCSTTINKRVSSVQFLQYQLFLGGGGVELLSSEKSLLVHRSMRRYLQLLPFSISQIRCFPASKGSLPARKAGTMTYQVCTRYVCRPLLSSTNTLLGGTFQSVPCITRITLGWVFDRYFTPTYSSAGTTFTHACKFQARKIPKKTRKKNAGCAGNPFFLYYCMYVPGIALDGSVVRTAGA